MASGNPIENPILFSESPFVEEASSPAWHFAGVIF